MNEIFHRRSIRKYQDRPVEKEKLEMLLRAAMAAPSAKNQQPWEFYLVTDKEKIVQLSKTSPYASFTDKAAAMIVPCFKKDCMIPEYAQIDLSIATENILLEADSLGLGACWIGTCPQEERMTAVEKVLDIPENLRAFSIVSIGYPAEERKQQDRFDKNRIHFIK
ncbi:MAG: nitroreductase family protein [Ruminococcaceae bacterium]|jgi:nitroreductase|nr:nitroreductase family protein [Oscillospiraceae bacterium]